MYDIEKWLYRLKEIDENGAEMEMPLLLLPLK